MTDEPILNITVPVFNRPELTHQTLLAARRNTPVPHVLTAVDNGSDSETRDLLAAMRDQGEIDHLFRLPENLGVAVAANVGWRLVDAPLYMKLDNDIVIHSPKWFPLLLAAIKQHGRPAVWGGDFHNQLDNPDLVTERDGFIGRSEAHVSGGAILIPRTVSDVIGYWSEDYGLYGCEDGDYGERLQVTGTDQFYFDHRLFMKHLGSDLEDMKEKYSLDKPKMQTLHRSLWRTNKYLYEAGHRAPSIPPHFVPVDYDGTTLRMEPNTPYQPMWDALQAFHRLAVQDDYAMAGQAVEALNRFISVQNETWEAAEENGRKRYDAIRRMLS